MFRIITENCNEESVKRLLESEGLDYTAFPASGAWHGVREGSFVIELEQPKEKVLSVAQGIAVLNNQESVLVEEIPTEYTFVGREGE